MAPHPNDPPLAELLGRGSIHAATHSIVILLAVVARFNLLAGKARVSCAFRHFRSLMDELAICAK